MRVVPDDEQARAAAQDISGFDTVMFGRRAAGPVVGASRARS